ncbi:hypothetical protein GCM10009855_28800 [Gordonia cholesterolivorans]|uniref:Uncharacterized protein n=1 Tax=Gordonia cholesterolivorans TaxID=559625 RepID=A0ABP5UVK7_9ACTN
MSASVDQIGAVCPREERLVQFSEYFDVAVDDDDDWFDPILDTDTRLFVDPFLIFKESDGPWSTAMRS